MWLWGSHWKDDGSKLISKLFVQATKVPCALIWLQHSYVGCTHGILCESNAMRSSAMRLIQQNSLEIHQDDIGFDTLADGATVVSVGFRQ